jgi:hypothetical protein
MQVNKIFRQARLFAFYRETDLYVSRLLIKLLTLLRSDRFTLRIWRHLADQTRHASLWSERLQLLGTHDLHLDINALCDKRPSPDQLNEPACLLREIAMVEEFLLKSYETHSALESIDPGTRDLMVRLVEDEKWHLHSVRAKLKMVDVLSDGMSADSRSQRFRAVEEELYDALRQTTSASNHSPRVGQNGPGETGIP